VFILSHDYFNVEFPFNCILAEPDASRVTAYWEAGNLMSAAVETNSDVYILEVGLESLLLVLELYCIPLIFYEVVIMSKMSIKITEIAFRF